MSRVRSKGTEPERDVRRFLSSLRVRYRLHSAMPGKPDLFIGRLRMAVFVNGCFWHQHDCKRATQPRSNVAFWTKKLQDNVARDARVRDELRQRGIRVIDLWTCEKHRHQSQLCALAREYHAKARHPSTRIPHAGLIHGTAL
jgi:DNA mismatch endonuclease, patch repair protein